MNVSSFTKIPLNNLIDLIATVTQENTNLTKAFWTGCADQLENRSWLPSILYLVHRLSKVRQTIH